MRDSLEVGGLYESVRLRFFGPWGKEVIESGENLEETGKSIALRRGELIKVIESLDSSLFLIKILSGRRQGLLLKVNYPPRPEMSSRSIRSSDPRVNNSKALIKK